MKIVHFSTGVSNGTAAYTLSKKLNDYDINSRVICLNTNVESNEIVSINNRLSRLRYKLYYYSEQILFKLLNPKNKIHHSLGFTFMSYDDVLKHIDKDEIVHLHWVLGGFFDLKLIEKISLTNTVIITHHDAWFSCGSEHHYSGNINIEESYLLSRLNIFLLNNKVKHERIYKNCHHIFPSQWLYKDFNSRCKVANYKQIMNCVSSDVFCDSKISIAEKIRISFGAVNVASNVMKGTEYVNKLLSLVNESEYLYSKVEIVIFGINKLEEVRSFFYNTYPNILFELHGFIHTKQELSLLYSSCDIFLNLSIIENLSTVILEASLSGCVVIAFDVGGNREASTESAILVRSYSLVELKMCYVRLIEKISRLSFDDRLTMRSNIRNISKGKFDDKKTIKSHVELYIEAVGKL